MTKNINKNKINLTIVVEGKSDVSRVSKSIYASFIYTSGLHISSLKYSEIQRAIDSTGIIIFTDPDTPGKAIRRKICQRFADKSSKIFHAYISAKEGRKKGDVGVENANDKSIYEALSNLRCENLGFCESVLSAFDFDFTEFYNENYCERQDVKPKLTPIDMIELGLSGCSEAKFTRILLSEKLRIPYSNANSMMKKLNSYKISKTDIISLLDL